MSSSLEDENYLNALHKSALFQDKEGLTRYVAANQADQIIIRQNNTIIELLISIHKKLDDLSNRNKEKSDIEKLTEQMANLKAIDPKKQMVHPINFGISEYKFGYKSKK